MLSFCHFSNPSTNIFVAVEKTDELLDVYGIPFTADTFLHEKKMAYLRFVGVSRALMHLVLD